MERRAALGLIIVGTAGFLASCGSTENTQPLETPSERFKKEVISRFTDTPVINLPLESLTIRTIFGSKSDNQAPWEKNSVHLVFTPLNTTFTLRAHLVTAENWQPASSRTRKVMYVSDNAGNPINLLSINGSVASERPLAEVADDPNKVVSENKNVNTLTGILEVTPEQAQKLHKEGFRIYAAEVKYGAPQKIVPLSTYQVAPRQVA